MEYLILEEPKRVKIKQIRNRIRQEKKPRYKILGFGEICTKCKQKMQRRGHLEKPKKTWYYEKWDYCKNCKHLQHYNDFKSNDWKEAERLENHFRNIY